jgi:hypothetical protein
MSDENKEEFQSSKQTRRLLCAQIGGGEGSWIGNSHRVGAEMDGKMEVVAGVFSSDSSKSKEFGKKLKLDADRVYSNFKVWPFLDASAT